jgi:hypothetical protein
MSSDGKYQSAVGGGQIYVSSDYGNTWVAKDSSRSWYGVAMSSDGKYQTAVVYNGQIYISIADTIIDGKVFTTNLNISGLQEGDSGLSTGDLYYIIDGTTKKLCIK